MGRRVREGDLARNPTANTVDHNREGFHKSRASPWGCGVRSPQLLGPALERWGSQNICLWKPLGLHPGDPKGCRDSRYFLSRACSWICSSWVPAQKQQFDKCLDYMWRRVFAIPQVPAGEKRTSWDFLQRWRYWLLPFLHSLYLASAGGVPWQHSPTALLKLVGMPRPQHSFSALLRPQVCPTIMVLPLSH